MGGMKEIGDMLIASVKEYVAAAVAGISRRLDEFDARIKAIPSGPPGESIKGDKGDPGAAGKDADPAVLKSMVEEAVSAIPLPKDGRDGIDGKDADLEIIRAEVAKAVAGLPPPKDGKDGAPGRDGENGKDADHQQVRALIEAEIERAVAAIPPAKDGAAGERGEKGLTGERGEAGQKGDTGAQGEKGDIGPAGPAGETGAAGERGERGEKGEPGAVGPAGADGKSVTVDDILPMFEAAFAKWALEVERRAMDMFQRKSDSMPVPKDGVDGLGIEDMRVEHDGDGNVKIRFDRGDIHKEFAIRLPRLKDRGVYRETETYREGDGVSYGGSLWLAQKDNPEGKPGTPDVGWRLAVKAGRDGRDFRLDEPKATPQINLK